MANLCLKPAIWILVVVSAMAWLGLAISQSLDLSRLQVFISLIPKVVTIDVLFVGVFVKWLWTWRIFQGWLVPFPNLGGTWHGQIISSWKNPETQATLPPIPAMLTIKQTFFHTSCVLRTLEMRSDSYSEGFQINADRQIRTLAYLYSSRPRQTVSGRSTPHDGSVVLDVIEKPNRKLVGRYWTERHTTGEMQFEFGSDDLLEEMPAGTGHPASAPKQAENANGSSGA